MSNMGRLIDGPNSIMLNKQLTNKKKCNCRDAANCSLNDNCLEENVIYKAIVKFDTHTEKVYIGSTVGTFKRFYNHKTLTWQNIRLAPALLTTCGRLKKARRKALM